MLLGESILIKSLLSSVSNKKILNVCSSDEDYYRRIQSFIYYNIMEPLQKRGNTFHNLDQKPMIGVDIVADVTDMPTIPDNSYDIVLFFNGLEHISKPKRAIKEIFRILNNSGILLASCPAEYIFHPDPIDTMMRLKNTDDWNKILNPWFSIRYFSKTDACEHGYPSVVVCDKKDNVFTDKLYSPINIFRYSLSDKNLSQATTGISRIYDFKAFYKTLSYSTHSINKYFPKCSYLSFCR